jgi:transketolase
MRDAFCRALIEAASRPDFVFLTGDLGYKALEPLREAMGPRFINAGVAEQNMIAVAAGMAQSGLRPWVYSIAPFVYARPFEQIRNDLCLHQLPVVLVGNGGGYGYGVMGATHHALEDYGALLCLPHIRAYVPAFDADVSALTRNLFAVGHPAYLRLGLSEEPMDADVPPYAPWRKLQDGSGWVIAATGSLAGSLWSAMRKLEGVVRPCLWLVSELPLGQPPEEFRGDLARARRLLVIEEHVAHGGMGESLATMLLHAGAAPERFVVRAAQGYLSGRFGSQRFHRRECGLDAASIVDFLSAADS